MCWNDIDDLMDKLNGLSARYAMLYGYKPFNVEVKNKGKIKKKKYLYTEMLFDIEPHSVINNNFKGNDTLCDGYNIPIDLRGRHDVEIESRVTDTAERHINPNGEFTPEDLTFFNMNVTVDNTDFEFRVIYKEVIMKGSICKYKDRKIELSGIELQRFFDCGCTWWCYVYQWCLKWRQVFSGVVLDNYTTRRIIRALISDDCIEQMSKVRCATQGVRMYIEDSDIQRCGHNILSWILNNKIKPLEPELESGNNSEDSRDIYYHVKDIEIKVKDKFIERMSIQLRELFNTTKEFKEQLKLLMQYSGEYGDKDCAFAFAVDSFMKNDRIEVLAKRENIHSNLEKLISNTEKRVEDVLNMLNNTSFNNYMRLVGLDLSAREIWGLINIWTIELKSAIKSSNTIFNGVKTSSKSVKNYIKEYNKDVDNLTSQLLVYIKNSNLEISEFFSGLYQRTLKEYVEENEIII